MTPASGIQQGFQRCQWPESFGRVADTVERMSIGSADLRVVRDGGKRLSPTCDGISYLLS